MPEIPLPVRIPEAVPSERQERLQSALADRRRAEEKYRVLFDSIDEGFCVIEVIFDETHVPVDYRFLEVNEAFARQTGLRDAVGKTMKELAPDHDAHWFEIYGRIALTGKAERFSQPAEALGRYFDVYAFRFGEAEQNQVAVLFNDIAERKRREEHQVFLADLSQSLVRLKTVEQTISDFGQRIGRLLHATVCSFAEVHEGEKLATVFDEWRRTPGHSLIGTYPLDQFLTGGIHEELAAGKTSVVNEIATDSRIANKEVYAAIRIEAMVNVPLFRDGRWVCIVGFCNDHPVVWKADEVALMEEASRRVWDRIERVRAEGALEADLHDTRVLQDLSARLVSETDSQAIYEEINNAGMKLMRADAGTVQIFDPQTRDLVLIATHGFPPDSPVRFGRVNADSATSCGMALASGKRIFLQFDDEKVDDPKGDLRWHVDAGYLSAQSTPLIARSGRPIGMISTHWRKRHQPGERELRYLDLLARQAADLVEQRVAEDKIRENEIRLRSLFNTMGEGFYISEAITDASGRVGDYLFVESNPAFSTHTGLDDPRGRRLLELLPDVDPQWMSRSEKVLRTGYPTTFEAYIGSIDRWLSVSVSRLGGAESKRIAVIFSDITQRRSEEMMLMEALQEADKARVNVEAANAAKDHFLAILSHELRTPLTPVVMTLSSLQRREDLDPAVRRGVEMIQRNIKMECGLIDDLLDVTRISRGRLEIVPEPMDLHEVIRSAVDVAEPEMEKKAQKFLLALEAEPALLQGDAARLRQAVWNLLRNASKFTPTGGTIRLVSRSARGGLEVEVTDTGLGIAPAQLNSIFKAFVQADASVSREYGGLGLGLAIAKATVEAHGGTIRAHSAGPGQGATFVFWLPGPA